MPPLHKHTQAPVQEKRYTVESSSDTTITKAPSSKMKRVAFIVLLITTILTPLIIIPSPYSPIDLSKSLVISMGVLISALLAFIPLIKERKIVLPKGKITIVSGLLVLSLIVSGLLGSNISKSFIGQGFEMFTVSFISCLFLLVYLVIRLTQNKEDRQLYIYTGLFISYAILVVFHVLRLIFGPDFMDLGILNSTISTLAGKWNDFTIMSGFIFIMSFFGIRYLSLGKMVKIGLYLALVASAFFVYLSNFYLIWWGIALVMIGLVAYLVSGKSSIKSMIIPSLVAIIALVCAFNVSNFRESIDRMFKVQQTEVVLPWQLTLDVTAETIKESPLFGAGPNRFGVQFLRYKPIIINDTDFWAVEFGNGFGTVPSFFVTQGIVGGILWISFLVLLVIYGVRSLRASFKQGAQPEMQFMLMSSFFGTMFLWFMNIVYIPAHSTLFITFLMTGIFISVLITQKHLRVVEYGSGDGFVHKIWKLAPIVLVIVISLWSLVYLKKNLAIAYFESGVSSLGKPGIDAITKAEVQFKKALSVDKIDVYYQALSEATILKISAQAQEIQKVTAEGNVPSAESVKVITDMVTEALNYTQSAIQIDPTNYYNYISQARISEVAQTLKIEGAYDSVKNSYLKALEVNPYNPAFYLALARLEASQGKIADAQKYIGASLQLKQNYLDAIFLLSQIQVSQGQIKDAITSVKVASQINPSNPLIFFQLGLLYYNDKNYEGAIESFNKAIELNGDYANARYFLGLSYVRMSNIPGAVEQFEELARTNPDSQEVALILSNLKEGKSPFADAQPPIDSKPEKRKTLPVKEKVETKSKVR